MPSIERVEEHADVVLASNESKLFHQNDDGTEVPEKRSVLQAIDAFV